MQKNTLFVQGFVSLEFWAICDPLSWILQIYTQIQIQQTTDTKTLNNRITIFLRNIRILFGQFLAI